MIKHFIIIITGGAEQGYKYLRAASARCVSLCLKLRKGAR
jgi:hypothetical protein